MLLSGLVKIQAAVAAAGSKRSQEIVESVSRVTDIMAEISAAGQEQNAGIEQVNVRLRPP